MNVDMLNADDRGIRAGNDLLVKLPEGTKLRPLRDHILLEPLAWSPSNLIHVEWRGKALRGRVLAVGPGRHPLKYDGPKGKRTKSWESKRFQATEVKVGDVVELGGLELRGYLFTTLMIGNQELVMCREGDVAGVVEPEAAHAPAAEV